MKKPIILLLTSILFIGMTSTLSLAAEALPDGKDYPAKLYHGETVTSVDRSDGFTNMFRTRFKQALSNETVFAGEYAMTEWGCGGSGCHVVAFINKRTGRALDTAFQAYEAGTSEEPESIGEEIVYLNQNSRLLVTDETTENGEAFRKYYVVKNNKLELIRKVPAEKE